MTPPFSAIAFRTSSGFIRLVFQSARAPACVMKMGFSLVAIVSSEVWSPECEMSIAIPSLFMRRTAWRPNSVNPPSRVSRRPLPSVLASLYAIPDERIPSP